MNTPELIERYDLLVRPAMFSEGWIAGVFRGIDGETPPAVFSKDGTNRQGKTIEEAVAKCVAAIEGKESQTL